MTDVTPLIRAGAQIIQAYGAAGVKVNGAMVSLPAIITPDETLPWDGTVASLAAFAGKIELVLLAQTGGAGGHVVPSSDRTTLRAVGMALEIMDLGAVCRTYNVLMAEGRKVAAAIPAPLK